MSKEIRVDFDTVFWSPNYRKNMYLYISNLKSRIYKAASQNNYKKLYLLQNRLISSPAAKIIALQEVINNTQDNKNITWSYMQQVYVVQKFNYSQEGFTKSANVFFSNSQKENLELLPMMVLSILLINLLKPSCNAIKDKVKYCIELEDMSKIVPIIKDILAENMLKKTIFAV